MAYDEFMRGMKMTASDMMGSGPMSDRESALNRRATDSYMKAMSQLMAQNQPPMGGGQVTDREMQPDIKEALLNRMMMERTPQSGATSDSDFRMLRSAAEPSTTDLTNFIINLGIKLRGGR